MATIREVAQHAGVSTATVSHVMNQTVYVSPIRRERVIKAMRELGYHPNDAARALKTKKSKTVGMIIPDITNPFFPAVVRGAEDVLAQEGYTLIIGNSDSDPRKEENYYRTFQTKRTEGMLLILSPSSPPPRYLREHNLDAVPIVYVDRFHHRLSGDVVIADNVGGSFDATSHLISSGHRRIAIITGPIELVNARLRLEGFSQALRAFRLKADKDLVRTGAFDTQSGHEQMAKLLMLSKPPSAVFVCNALMTIGALRALTEKGVRCPEDIALVSFDDLEWFSVAWPTITAVAQPAYQLGATAAELLVRRISGKLCGPPHKKVLGTELVVRDSSRMAKKTA
ncbi:MAG: LacI family transcriptional regulator [Acidobacteria bacterium]|nr:LacI family transcriptional regulator [Acidobacteriota bacterium]